MAVDREFHVYMFGQPRTGRTGGGRTGGRRADGGRTGGRAAGPVLNDSTTIFIDFHKKHPKTLCFSVVSRPAEAQVPIFTGQMKKASKKHQKTTVFFDFSNHAGAQVPIFTPKMKKFPISPVGPLCPPEHPEMGFSTPLATWRTRAQEPG